MKDDLEHLRKFRPSEFAIRDFRHWLVVVRGKQVTLGSAVFLLKRPASSLGELTADEAAELPQVSTWFQDRATSLYGAERFNYVAAMMKDPWVHFHVFPRYGSPREAYGNVWVDESWPRIIDFKDVDTSEDILAAIRDDLKS